MTCNEFNSTIQLGSTPIQKGWCDMSDHFDSQIYGAHHRDELRIFLDDEYDSFRAKLSKKMLTHLTELRLPRGAPKSLRVRYLKALDLLCWSSTDPRRKSNVETNDRNSRKKK